MEIMVGSTGMENSHSNWNVYNEKSLWLLFSKVPIPNPYVNPVSLLCI